MRLFKRLSRSRKADASSARNKDDLSRQEGEVSNRLRHQPNKRRWPQVSAGLLCIFQACFLTFIFPAKLAIMIYQLPPEQLELLLPSSGGLAPLQFELAGLLDGGLDILFAGQIFNVPSSILTSLLFTFFAIPLLLAGLFFWQRKRGIWTTAVFMEGLILSLSLVVYFNYHPNYIYLVMLSGILAVFYLNTYDVQVAFQELPMHRDGEA